VRARSITGGARTATAALVSTAVALLCTHGLARADARFARDTRVTYVSNALAALDAMDPTTRVALTTELQTLARTTCKAAATEPPVACLLGVAAKTCGSRPAGQQAGCKLIADLVFTNLVGEKEVVSSKVRLTLMNDVDGYRVAINRHLMSRYAILVARLTLSRGFDQGAGLARSIDAFCSKHILRSSTTWARCVSGIAWYIGTAHKQPPAPVPDPRPQPANAPSPEGK